jgi:hypothetical protein
METPCGLRSSPTTIQFHAPRRISLAAISKRLGGAGAGRVHSRALLSRGAGISGSGGAATASATDAASSA